MCVLFTECIWRGQELTQNNVTRSVDRAQEIYEPYSFVLHLQFLLIVDHLDLSQRRRI